MNIAVRLAVAAAITAIGLYADSTFEWDSDGGDGDGSPFNFEIPQFDPSLGTLNSMTFNVSLGETILIPLPNCFFGSSPLINYSYDITAGFSILGSSVETTQSRSDSMGITCGGIYEPEYLANIDGSGLVSDTNPYIGTGSVDVVPSDYFAAGVFSYDDASYQLSSDFGGGLYIEPVLFGYLDVTYDYTSVPEPTMLPLTLLLVGALFSLGRWRKPGS